jgi:beta-carotene/zeaxanthin 4-ketolase
MGIMISSIVILAWLTHLLYILDKVQVDFTSSLFYFHVLFQGYLYTGLFITGHDAMHGNISKNKAINKIFGTLSSILFAGMSYNRLVKNHFRHHADPGSAEDPDFYMKSQNFFLWWGSFMYRYTTISQLIIMAVAFNILKLFFLESSIWFFWVISAFLGTFQLFFFGTYLPHRYPHENFMKPHNARTQKKNHLWAMLSCYFFGYHYEHHAAPKTPWWKLYELKNNFVNVKKS